MKRSFFFKSFQGYVFITLLLAVLVFLFSSSIIRTHYIGTLSSDLEHLGTALLLRLTPLVEERAVDSLDALAKKLGTEINTRITVIDPDGHVLADSKENPHDMDNHRWRPEIANALEGAVGTSVRYSRTVKQDMLYVAVPVFKDGRIIGVVRTSLFLDDINTLLNTLRIRILLICAIIAAASLILAAFFSRNLSQPVRELVRASRRVADGDFDVTVLLKRKDELRELADSFNDMVSQIKNLFNEVSLEKEALNTIIASIQEGVLVLDRQGRIVLCNDSFKRIVNAPCAAGHYYWEVVRTPQLGQLVDMVLHQEDTVVRHDVRLSRRSFVCSATHLSVAQQTVVTFHDVTELLDLAVLKKDFILNVSHELRTPLTAIKGFIETLEQESRKNATRYLEIIKKHTERLINIVQDLQMLSELEETERIELEEVNLRQLLETIHKLFEQRLKEKGLALKVTVAHDVASIAADPFKLEQMFVNLIDNAIKYTEKGEVRISAEPYNSSVKITIEDTGTGIPEQHLGRIFERFYVVDKSRSRKMGGTGLGLSIVKHIVQAHNGTIQVTSEANKGTTFTIIIPKLR
jgi:two-component system phosphate regulon sensor histidine kinase PhoR